jgi:SAM-dependent methyltransferase
MAQMVPETRKVNENFEQELQAWREYAEWSEHVSWPADAGTSGALDLTNPLRRFFEAHKRGHGIWKWNHYFEIYHRHFSKFRGREVHILEIGIYSGGSLEMWKDYFGAACHIYGIDIEPACKAYEDKTVRVFIGDQADRGFWQRFKREAPKIDIVIDDGGHLPEQQMAAFEELLPHLRPGGVYLCEDVHRTFNRFASYVHRFAHDLNACDQHVNHPEDDERRIVSPTTALQSAVNSIHLYPFVTVVERTDAPVAELVAPKHGTEWQPFLK